MYHSLFNLGIKLTDIGVSSLRRHDNDCTTTTTTTTFERRKSFAFFLLTKIHNFSSV